MNLIALKNFKSYEHQVINNLSPNINIIIGKNGQGKSNFFKGMYYIMQPSSLLSPIESPITKLNITLTCMYINWYQESYGQYSTANNSLTLCEKQIELATLWLKHLQTLKNLVKLIHWRSKSWLEDIF